jgi:hypothetical protein
MPVRILNVKLKPKGAESLPVRIIFQVGDWAVTQAICVFHADRCFRVTHIPSTQCIPVCLQAEAVACHIAKRVNGEIPKFKSRPKPDTVVQYANVVREELEKARLPLVRS